jgi:DNA repair ATPase RecN
MGTPQKRKRTEYKSLAPLITACMDSIIFDAEGISGFAHLNGDAKLNIVFGDNASGKSLMLTALRAFIGPREESGAESFTVSMNMRTNGGMARAFMYQDESYSSTGAASLSSVTGAFRNAAARTHPVWLFLDEPDTGLSDRYASAMGAFIAQQVNALPDHVRGVTLVSHSRPLLRRLLRELHAPPHDISMGVDRTLAEFVDPVDLQEASIEELLAFGEHAAMTLKNVAAVLRS